MIVFIIVWSCSDKTFQARLLGLAEAAEALETVEEGTEGLADTLEVPVECSDVLEVTEEVAGEVSEEVAEERLCLRRSTRGCRR